MTGVAPAEGTSPSLRWAAIKAAFERCADAAPTVRPQTLAEAVRTAGLTEAEQAELASLLAHHDAAASATRTAAAFLGRAAEAAAAFASGPAAAQGQRLGAWQVTRHLGTGGMGEVFEVRRADGSFEGRAAAKLLKRGMDSAAVLQRFAQERQALARLNHPHIARLLDAGASDDGLPYFVMEHVDGRPLHEAADVRPLRERLALFLQLADAVAHAHRHLLVHRDLKPGNVLVNAEGQVKLLDFGIAKALDPLEGAASETTALGARPFTPQYASPEQVRGEPVTTATDVYSLGVLLVQVLTGQRPTGRAARTPAELARAVLDEAPGRPSRLAAEAPPGSVPAAVPARLLEGDLDKVLLKALEKLPARRYASVDAFADDVRAVLDGRPVAARAASPGYVLGKFVARHRWAVAAGALGGLGLATGLAAALLQERVAVALGALGLAAGLGLALLRGRQAQLARELAESRLTETRAIARDMMERHADAIHFLPGGAELRVQMLENLVEHLERLYGQAEGDAAFAGELAMARARLAHLQSDSFMMAMEQADAAERHARQALPLFELGLAAHGHNPRYWIWWVRAWRGLAGVARSRSELSAAAAHMAHMVEVAERGLKRHPQAEDLASELGSALIGQSQLLSTWGVPSLRRPAEALTVLDRAEALYRAIHDRSRVWEDRHQLATVATGRAMALSDLGRLDEALAVGEGSLAIRRELRLQHSEHVAVVSTLASDASNLSVIYLEAGQPERALATIDEALAAADDLVRMHPDTPSWAHSRVRLGLHRARALMALGRAGEALPLLAPLCAPDAPPGHQGTPLRAAWAGVLHAQCQLALGRRDLARQALERLEPVIAALLPAPDTPAATDPVVRAAARALQALRDSLDGAEAGRAAPPSGAA